MLGKMGALPSKDMVDLNEYIFNNTQWLISRFSEYSVETTAVQAKRLLCLVGRDHGHPSPSPHSVW